MKFKDVKQMSKKRVVLHTVRYILIAAVSLAVTSVVLMTLMYAWIVEDTVRCESNMVQIQKDVNLCK